MLLRPHRLCHLDGIAIFICLSNRLQLLLITNQDIGILLFCIRGLIVDNLPYVITPAQLIIILSLCQDLLRLQLRHLGGKALSHHIVVLLGILQLLVASIHHLAQAEGLRHVIPRQDRLQLILGSPCQKLIVVVDVDSIRILIVQRRFCALPFRHKGTREAAGQRPHRSIRQSNVVHQLIAAIRIIEQDLAIVIGEHRTCAKGLRLCISAVHHRIAANGIQLESMINAHRSVLKQCGAGLGLHVLRGVGGDRRLRGRKQLVNFQILRCFLHL